MSRGINKCIILGNAGQDADVRYSQSGSAMATVSIATSEKWKDKQSGEDQERTEWHRIKFFGKLAEIVGEYVKKGTQIYVEGSLRTSKYTDKEGIERYTTDIIAREMQLVGGKPQGSSGASHGGAPARQQAPAPQRSQARAPEPAMADASNGMYPDEDDIPFAPLGRHQHW